MPRLMQSESGRQTNDPLSSNARETNMGTFTIYALNPSRACRAVHRATQCFRPYVYTCMYAFTKRGLKPHKGAIIRLYI